MAIFVHVTIIDAKCHGSITCIHHCACRYHACHYSTYGHLVCCEPPSNVKAYMLATVHASMLLASIIHAITVHANTIRLNTIHARIHLKTIRASSTQLTHNSAQNTRCPDESCNMVHVSCECWLCNQHAYSNPAYFMILFVMRVKTVHINMHLDAGSVSMPQQSNTFIVNAQQRPQLGQAAAHMPPRQPTPPPPLSEDDKKFLNKPVGFSSALHHHRCQWTPLEGCWGAWRGSMTLLGAHLTKACFMPSHVLIKTDFDFFYLLGTHPICCAFVISETAPPPSPPPWSSWLTRQDASADLLAGLPSQSGFPTLSEILTGQKIPGAQTLQNFASLHQSPP